MTKKIDDSLFAAALKPAQLSELERKRLEKLNKGKEMNFSDITARLARTMRINVPVGLPEQQAAAAVMVIAIKLIEYQQQSIALSATMPTVLDMSPISHEQN